MLRPSGLPLSQADRLSAFSPETGTFSRQVVVGSNPTRLVLSTSGKTAFIGMGGVNNYRTVNLADLSTSPLYDLGTGRFGRRFAEDLAPLPGSETSVAVSLMRLGITPKHDGVAIFDSGVQRPTMTGDHTGSNRIGFGDTVDTFFGIDTDSSSRQLRKMSINSSGVVVDSVQNGLSPGFRGGFRAWGNRMVTTDGSILEPLTGRRITTLPKFGLVEIDVPNQRIYVLSEVPSSDLSSRDLTVFRMSDYSVIGSTRISGLDRTTRVLSLTRFGYNGIAFINGQQIVTLNTALVPEPGTLAALGLGVAAVLRKKRKA